MPPCQTRQDEYGFRRTDHSWISTQVISISSRCRHNRDTQATDCNFDEEIKGQVADRNSLSLVEAWRESS